MRCLQRIDNTLYVWNLFCKQGGFVFTLREGNPVIFPFLAQDYKGEKRVFILNLQGGN